MSKDASAGDESHGRTHAAGCKGCDPTLAPLIAAVASGDLDTAIEAGLLALQPKDLAPTQCDACRNTHARLLEARDLRLTALAARSRHRQRSARIASRVALRAEARHAGLAQVPAGDGSARPTDAGLPPAAAAALARALARAIGRS